MESLRLLAAALLAGLPASLTSPAFDFEPTADTSGVRMAWGRPAGPALAPRTDAEFLRLAQQHLAGLGPGIGLDPATLQLERSRWLPLGLIGSVDKLALLYRQTFDGVPVEGRVGVLLDVRGRLLALDHAAGTRDRSSPAEPVVEAAEAERVAQREFAARTGTSGRTRSPPALLFARDPSLDEHARTLVWSTVIAAPNAFAGGAPRHVLELRVGALDGRLVEVRDRLLRFDVEGTVAGWITPGLVPDDLAHGAIAQTSCSPCSIASCSACPPTSCGVAACGPDCSAEIAVPFADVEVRDALGNVAWTDADGRFVLPGAPPRDVTVRFRGRHVTVVNGGGADYALAQTIGAAAGTRLLLGGPAPYAGDALLTAQANAYQWGTRLRRWIASVDPTDTTWEQDPFPKLLRVNLPQSVIGCSGEFDLPPAHPTVSGGPEVLFAVGGGVCGFAQQPPAGCGCCGVFSGLCTNKANATYVLHELGHWMSHLYLGVDSASAFNEGLADAWSIYVTGDPRLFPFDCTFQTCSRSGENCRQFAGYQDQFVGDPHKKGEPLMGALWKVRSRLVAAHGESVGSGVADALFLAWISAFPEFAIHGGIKRRWVILDDDDGDPLTPSPHQAEILGGFESHGL
jgi:hypothetical protein